MQLEVPGLEALLKYVASGIGSVAGPMLAPWRAKREAVASSIAARAQAENTRIIAEAQTSAQRTLSDTHFVEGFIEINPEGITQRIEYQEKKRHSNISTIVQEAAMLVEDKKVQDHEPDHDWTAQFFASVQDVSSEELRVIWSRILASEVQEQGTTSLRTLATLKTLSSAEAHAFAQVAANRFCGYLLPIPSIEYDNYTLPLIEQASLVQSQKREYFDATIRSGSDVIHREPGCILVVQREEERSVFLGFNGLKLTQSGQEIAQSIDPVPDLRFLSRVANTLNSNGYKLLITTKITRDELGNLGYDNADLQEIEPAHS